MLICPKCQPDHDFCDGDTPASCKDHELESPTSESRRPQENYLHHEAPNADRVQGRFLFDLPPQSTH